MADQRSAQLRHVRPAETGLALVALDGVLVFGFVGGVVVAIALSIGVFLYRSARPHDAVLGRIDDVDGYHDNERWEGAQVVPGPLVYRFDAPPFFVNAEYLRTRVLALAEAAPALERIVLDAGAWTYLDATAIDSLAQLHDDLEKRNVELCFARLKGRQREIVDETGLTARIARSGSFPRCARRSPRSSRKRRRLRKAGDRDAGQLRSASTAACTVG